MNLDELQSVQSRERQTDSLQQLRASFYEDAAEFVQDLREQREAAAAEAEDPFDSPDVNRLTDDIKTAEQTVEAIYERRVGKVVKMASLAAADMPTEQDGLTKEEQDLFETMVGAIEDHRERILAVLGGDAPAGAVSSPPPEDHTPGNAAGDAEPADDDGDTIDAAAVMGDDDGATVPEGTPAPDPGEFEAPATDSGQSGTAEAATGSPETATDSTAGETAPAPDGEAQDPEATGEQAAAATDRTTVRITEDVGEIFGVDEREYDLSTDDVVTLPTTNAEPLIDRDAAEPLE
jgi:DNA replication factor GINS